MRVSKRAIFLRSPKPVKKAFDFEDRLEPSITEISVRGNSHFFAIFWMDWLSSSSSSGVNLLKRGSRKEGAR